MSIRGVTEPVAIANEHMHIIAPRVINYRKRKRILDVVGSAVLLMLLFPLMLVIAILIKLTSEGSVFFVTDRVGLCGKPFPFYKFRSMRLGSDQQKDELAEQNEREGPIFKMKTDPRVTPIGRFMRKPENRLAPERGFSGDLEAHFAPDALLGGL